MTSYYNPDHYIDKINAELKNLAKSIQERIDELDKKIAQVESKIK